MRQSGNGAWFGWLLISAAAGCAVGPNYHPPTPAIPASFDGSKQADVRRWWETFNDSQLNSLIDRATKSNLDVRLAEARVREARAQR